MFNTDELREKTDLQALVESDLGKPAIRGGKAWLWSCPFHSEKKASFAVYPDGYKCFGCGKHGDAITWLQEYKGLSFRDSCLILGGDPNEKLAIARAEHKPKIYVSMPPSPDWQQKAIAAMNDCQAVLWTEAGRAARDYLHARGLTEETIRRWRLGYQRRTCELHGLFIPRGIVIPHLHKATGTLWALQVRKPKGSDPKYQQVAGGRLSLYMADTLAGQTTAFVCEGELDALLLWQHAGNLAGVVTFGGASSLDIPSWIDYLEHLKRLVIVTDTDEAGHKAASLWKSNRRARRALPPISPADGKDLTDSWQHGADLRQWAIDTLVSVGCSPSLLSPVATIGPKKENEPEKLTPKKEISSGSSTQKKEFQSVCEGTYNLSARTLRPVNPNGPGQRLYTDLDACPHLMHAFTLAERLGYHELTISEYETIAGGAHNWRNFLEHASDRQLNSALSVLEAASVAIPA